MRTIIISLLMCFCSLVLHSQNFQSVEQIVAYLNDSIATLDPIEGKYDVLETIKTNSPFQKDMESNYTFYIVKSSIPDEFEVFIENKSEFYLAKAFTVYSLGDTNVYRVNLKDSSGRGYLLNEAMRFTFEIELTNSDARAFVNNPNFSYNVKLDYDLIKILPTKSMYFSTKKNVEESKLKQWAGTGFALLDDIIATNYHVIENATEIFIQGIGGSFNEKYRAKVIASDKINDLALLKIENVTINSASIPYSIKTAISEVGENVFVLGYPLTSTMGDEIKLTTGIVSSKTGFQGDVSLYQVSAPIQPGNSGGPLFDENGNVIGIVSAKHVGAENVSYAIKASYLRILMESVISANILPQKNKISVQSLSEKVKMVKDYIYYITCSNNK